MKIKKYIMWIDMKREWVLRMYIVAYKFIRFEGMVKELIRNSVFSTFTWRLETKPRNASSILIWDPALLRRSNNRQKKNLKKKSKNCIDKTYSSTINLILYCWWVSETLNTQEKRLQCNLIKENYTHIKVHKTIDKSCKIHSKILKFIVVHICLNQITRKIEISVHITKDNNNKNK